MLLNIQLLDNGNIQLQSDNITTFINNLSQYLKIKITCTINCCSNLVYTVTETVVASQLPPGEFIIVGNTIQVTPQFFNVNPPADKLMDGVYSFEVKLFYTEGFGGGTTYTYEQNCAFIDITFKCRVAKTLENLLTTSEPNDIATNAHILHYALVNGSNCGCNCNEMCEVFKELKSLLLPPELWKHEPNISGNCGCN